MVFSFASLTKEEVTVPNTTYKKFTALFSLSVCALLLILTVLSGYYIAAESGHECHEEDCPVCAALEICEAVLNRIGSAMPIMGIAVITYLTVIRAEGITFEMPERSLVEEKIRMND